MIGVWDLSMSSLGCAPRLFSLQKGHFVDWQKEKRKRKIIHKEMHQYGIWNTAAAAADAASSRTTTAGNNNIIIRRRMKTQLYDDQHC